MTVPRVAAWPAPALPGQVALQGLTMGYGTFYAIETIEGLDLPPISAAEAIRAATDGTFGGIDTMPKRSLILHMLLHPDMVAGGPAKAILARNVKAAFATTQDLVGLTINDPALGQLVLLGRPRRCAFAVDRTVGWHVQEGVLAQFDALDPLLYNAVLQDVVIGYGTAGTNAGFTFHRATPAATPGLAFNRATPAATPGAASDAAGGGGGAAGFQVLVNNGNQATDPVSTISAPGGPVTGPLHLERVESGEVITLNYNMNVNDTLELDHDLHTVTLNGNTNRADIVDPSTTWWQLRPGNNTIHYRTDGPGAGSQAEVKWRDAWL